MIKPALSSRWYLPWRQREARLADDPADLGTAFGLDLSLASEAAPPPAALPARRSVWMQRLTLRRRAAT